MDLGSNEMLNNWESKFLAPLNVNVNTAPISPNSADKNGDPSLRYMPMSAPIMRSDVPLSAHFEVNAMPDFQSLISPPVTPAERLNPFAIQTSQMQSYDMIPEPQSAYETESNYGNSLYLGAIHENSNLYHDGQQSAGYELQHSAGYDGQQSAGYDGQHSAGYDGQHSASYDGNYSAGYSPSEQGQYAWVKMENQMQFTEQYHEQPHNYSPNLIPHTRVNPLKFNGKSLKHSGSDSSLASWSTNGTNSSYNPNEWQAQQQQEGAFKCTFPGCQKIFTKQTNLKSHSRIHHTERNYACQECGTAFRRSHDLKRHQRSLHSDVKPFGCQRCGKRFSRMVIIVLF